MSAFSVEDVPLEGQPDGALLPVPLDVVVYADLLELLQDLVKLTPFVEPEDDGTVENLILVGAVIDGDVIPPYEPLPEIPRPHGRINGNVVFKGSR